jgi:hypothetical protein
MRDRIKKMLNSGESVTVNLDIGLISDVKIIVTSVDDIGIAGTNEKGVERGYAWRGIKKYEIC